jgi:hypothetical protein
MGEACSAYGGVERRVQSFGGKIWGKETPGFWVPYSSGLFACVCSSNTDVSEHSACSICLPQHRRPLYVRLRLSFEPNLFPFKYPNIFNPSHTSYILAMKMEHTECSETSAFKLDTPVNRGTRYHSWLRHCVTRRKVAGSFPDGVTGILHWHNPSGRTRALMADSASNRNEYQE